MENKYAKKGRSPEEWKKVLKSKGAPEKYQRMIDHIEESGKEQGKSKEYIMRTIIDKIPKKYLEEPTGHHGKGKSGPLSTKKKSVFLSEDDHRKIVGILEHIAVEHGIRDVYAIELLIDEDSSVVEFNIVE